MDNGMLQEAASNTEPSATAVGEHFQVESGAFVTSQVRKVGLPPLLVD
jgi:hypothetical protein